MLSLIESIKNALKVNQKQDLEFGSFEGDQISFAPNPIRAGETLNINYNGWLKDSGSHEIYLHYGFDGWHGTQETKMNRTDQGLYTINIPAEGREEINFCFKDTHGNWDNNHGNNWTLHFDKH